MKKTTNVVKLPKKDYRRTGEFCCLEDVLIAEGLTEDILLAKEIIDSKEIYLLELISDSIYYFDYRIKMDKDDNVYLVNLSKKTEKLTNIDEIVDVAIQYAASKGYREYTGERLWFYYVDTMLQEDSEKEIPDRREALDKLEKEIDRIAYETIIELMTLKHKIHSYKKDKELN